MSTNDQQTTISEVVQALGPAFAERAARHDLEGSFVGENYRELKEHKVFSAGVPAELGGGGASHRELCEALRELGKYCGSTALALSMHTHLVAAQVWRHRHGMPAEALLRKVAAGQLVLVSTGAGDWLNSVGEAVRVEGGFKVNAVKRFSSGSPAGDLLVTSAPYDDAKDGAQVIHFAVPMRAPGVTRLEDWDVLGMRGSGSHSVELKDVFVPQESISLQRVRGQWHPSWSVIITVAPPIYLAPYLGVVERAAELAREHARRAPSEPGLWTALGELENSLTTAQMAFREMVELTNGYDFEPALPRCSRMLVRKTIATNAILATANRALELVGGRGLFRRGLLERLVRDAQGARFHPLPERQQLSFTGQVELGLSPVV